MNELQNNYDKGASHLEKIVSQLLHNGDVFWLKKTKKKRRKKERKNSNFECIFLRGHKMLLEFLLFSSLS